MVQFFFFFLNVASPTESNDVAVEENPIKNHTCLYNILLYIIWILLLSKLLYKKTLDKERKKKKKRKQN